MPLDLESMIEALYISLAVEYVLILAVEVEILFGV